MLACLPRLDDIKEHRNPAFSVSKPVLEGVLYCYVFVCRGVTLFLRILHDFVKKRNFKIDCTSHAFLSPVLKMHCVCW